MGVLSTLTASLRTSLAAAPASLTALPESFAIEDTPDTDKTYFKVGIGPDDVLDNEHGGGTYVMRQGSVTVSIVWGLDDDEEAFEDTKGNDLENVGAVMDKVSNWTSGVVLVSRSGASETRENTYHRADLTYSVRYRVAQTLT